MTSEGLLGRYGSHIGTGQSTINLNVTIGLAAQRQQQDYAAPQPGHTSSCTAGKVLMFLGTVSDSSVGCVLRRLLAGVSGVDEIKRFDASEYPTRFAAQIKDFDDEG